MSSPNRAPKTLIEAIRYFADPDVALNFLASLRWPDGPSCPRCGSLEHSFLKTRRIWKCKACQRQFSVKLGTIFEDSPIGLDKWLPCLWMIANDKNGISSYEVARGLGVTQKTAWFMLHRIRLAMQTETFGKMGGDVEVDETYIGGKRGNQRHERKVRIGFTGSSHPGKTAVMGVLQRGDDGSQVQTAVITTGMKKPSVQGMVRARVKAGSNVYTDALRSYIGLDQTYTHQVIDHAVRYVDGQVHTNGLENFWSLLKRALKGTYISVEPFHLFRYLDEQVFRYNARKNNDAGRFVSVLRNAPGRRLTYKTLIGADDPRQATC
jgi:transposase-like protein